MSFATPNPYPPHLLPPYHHFARVHTAAPSGDHTSPSSILHTTAVAGSTGTTTH
ncbi:hypothetical protein A2U01_0115318, partial [Trifolium medium]|nr:hypothetical protein [Trifolium medium]